MPWRVVLLWCLSTQCVLCLSLIDDQGQVFEFGRPTQRIVSLMPHGTELLFALGAGDRLVGAVEYSDFPEAARQIPRVGSASGLNIERIAALRPDVVLAWPQDNSQRDLLRLQQLQLPVVRLRSNSYEDIARNLQMLGELVGKASVGQGLAQQFRQQVAELRQHYQSRPAVRVFYQVWNDPLMTQNGDTFISRAIELCGGRNVFAEMPLQAPQIRIEAVLEVDPEAIVASATVAGRPQWLDEWQRFSSLAAVQSQSLYHIPPDLFNRPTLRFLQGTRQLCQQLEKTRQWRATLLR